MQAYHNIPTEERFMQILYNYGDSSMEEKRFLIVNCDNVFQDRDDVSFNCQIIVDSDAFYYITHNQIFHKKNQYNYDK